MFERSAKTYAEPDPTSQKYSGAGAKLYKRQTLKARDEGRDIARKLSRQ